MEEKNYSNQSINKEIGHLWSKSDLMESTISDLESSSNFQVKEKNIEIGPETTKLCYIKNAKKDFNISAFCSLTGKPMEKIFTE